MHFLKNLQYSASMNYFAGLLALHTHCPLSMSRTWQGRIILSLSYWLYWKSDFSGSFQSEPQKDIDGRARWHPPSHCVLARWDLGKDLQNWALVKQGSHRTLLPCSPWWDEGSRQAAGELSRCGVILPRLGPAGRKGATSPHSGMWCRRRGRSMERRALLKRRCGDLFQLFTFFSLFFHFFFLHFFTS